MNFASDNVAGAHPALLQALADINNQPMNSYGEDPFNAQVEQECRRIFEHDSLKTVLVATGSAANALALATMTPAWGAIYCHNTAHIVVDEANAVQAATAGARLVTLPGEQGKTEPDALRGASFGHTCGRARPSPARLPWRDRLSHCPRRQMRAGCRTWRRRGRRPTAPGRSRRHRLVTAPTWPTASTWARRCRPIGAAAANSLSSLGQRPGRMTASSPALEGSAAAQQPRSMSRQQTWRRTQQMNAPKRA